MRQLKVSKQPTDPAWEAEKANALPFLRQLAAARPLGLAPAGQEQYLRFIAATARQYRNQGASWESLLTAGYEAVVSSLELEASRPGEGSRYLTWRVRQKIVKVVS
ncbi:hypothetical protein GCM10027422_04780 [Hymenobacter arcticus]